MIFKKRQICFVLLTSLLFIFCSCGRDTGLSEKTTGTTEYDAQPMDPMDEKDGLLLVEAQQSSYTIVCDTEVSELLSAARYLRTQFRQKTGASVSVDELSVSTGKRILIGIDETNALFSAANELMLPSDDYAIVIDGENLIITGRTTAGLLNAVLLFTERYLSGDKTDKLEIPASDTYVYSKAAEKYDYAARMDAAAYCEAYQSVFSTYSTRYEYEYANVISEAAWEDQALVDAILDRIGNGYVFEIGYTVALHQGKIRKLDITDYSKKLVRNENNQILIPENFVKLWMDETATADQDGYVSLNTLCENHPEWNMWVWEECGLVLVLDHGTTGFEPLTEKVGAYTNQQYLERMDIFFHTTMTPEPGNDTEQSRVVIEHIPYPEAVCDFRYNTYNTTYSPSIALDENDGIKTIYVSYEISEVYGADLEELSTVTVIKKSVDDGNTWSECAQVPDLRWGSLFVYEHEAYVIGNHIEDGSLMLAHLKADGTVETISGFLQCGGGAPNAVLIRDGRFYKAYSQSVASVPVAELMNPSAWIRSNNMREFLTVEWLRKVSGQAMIGINAIDASEPNLVVGRDGVIYVLYRVNHVGTDRQIVVKLSDDGTTLSPVEEIDSFLVGFPTSLSKVIIRYDESTDRYIALSNAYTGAVLTSQRTVLCIASSEDLFHWEIEDYLLVSRDIASPLTEAYRHAYQYPDFVFGGDDLLVVVREASDYANYFHDGTYTTFYRVSNYRNLLSIN